MIDQSTLAEIANLHRRARARLDAAAQVDPAHTAFLARLGALKNNIDSGFMAPAEAARQRDFLVSQHLTMLRSVAEASDSQLPAVLFPATPAVQQSRTAHAAEVLQQARNAGVVLTSPAHGTVEARPAAKLTTALRELVAGFRVEIAAILRADLEIFAA